MSGRGIAPAPPADPVVLLAPGADAFFLADREGRALAARSPIDADDDAAADADPAHADDDADAADPARPRLFLGAAAFDGTPTRRSFSAYETVLHGAVPAADGGAGRLTGALDDPDDRDAWRELAAEALGVIHSDAASKIVVARRVRLHAAAPVDAAALARSMMRADGTYRYLLRRGGVVFAGASPELLIEKRGDVIRTEAVAGTAPAQHDGTPLDLRDKDRREHLAVVLAIEEALAPHTLALEHDDSPHVRAYGRIAHLVTPFEGRVDPATHVLDLAAALHPTPAVAGTPRAAALGFIARRERPRGWYAGPVGWFDGNGDGTLAVALRCVRIEGRTVELYAGAGLVAGSDPDAEFDETVLKMKSTLASLGFELAA